MKLKPQHITVNGNDLATELAALKAKKCMVESIDCRVGGKNSAYQINFVNLAGNKNGEDVKGAPVPSALAIQHSRKLDSLPSNVAGRTSLISEVTGKSERERQMEETPPDTVNPSISDRMARLKAAAIKSERVRVKFKPSTSPENARAPHKNE